MELRPGRGTRNHKAKLTEKIVAEDARTALGRAFPEIGDSL